MLGGDVGLPQAATGALDFKWTNCRNNVPTLTTANAKSRSRTRECVRITNRREPEKVVYVATAVELRSRRIASLGAHLGRHGDLDKFKVVGGGGLLMR